MALLSRLFGGRKRSGVKSPSGYENVPEFNPWRPVFLAEDQVSFVVFRECERRGPRVMFDTATVQLVRCGPEHRALRDVENDTGFKWNRPRPESAQLGEMVFGTVAMSYTGATCKVHVLKGEPAGPEGTVSDTLVMSRVFPIPRTPGRRVTTQGSSGTSLDDSCSSTGSELSLLRLDGGSHSLYHPRSSSMDCPPPGGRSSQDSGLSSIDSYVGPPSCLPTPYGTPISAQGSGGSLGSHGSLLRPHGSSDLVLPSCGDDVTLRPAGRTRLAVCLLVKLPGPGRSALEDTLLQYSPQLEHLLARLQQCVERAFISRRQFVRSVHNGTEAARQEVRQLLTSPRLTRPVWLGLTCPESVLGSPQRRQLMELFVRELTALTAELDTKEHNCFISTLLTAVLTHHLTWVTTVAPLAAGDGTRLDGAAGHPPRPARTLVVSRRTSLVRRLLLVLSYFIRARLVTETMPWSLSPLRSSNNNTAPSAQSLQPAAGVSTASSSHVPGGRTAAPVSETVPTAAASEAVLPGRTGGAGSQISGSGHQFAPSANQSDSAAKRVPTERSSSYLHPDWTASPCPSSAISSGSRLEPQRDGGARSRFYVRLDGGGVGGDEPASHALSRSRFYRSLPRRDVSDRAARDGAVGSAADAERGGVVASAETKEDSAVSKVIMDSQSEAICSSNARTKKDSAVCGLGTDRQSAALCPSRVKANGESTASVSGTAGENGLRTCGRGEPKEQLSERTAQTAAARSQTSSCVCSPGEPRPSRQACDSADGGGVAGSGLAGARAVSGGPELTNGARRRTHSGEAATESASHGCDRVVANRDVGRADEDVCGSSSRDGKSSILGENSGEAPEPAARGRRDSAADGESGADAVTSSEPTWTPPHSVSTPLAGTSRDAVPAPDSRLCPAPPSVLVSSCVESSEECPGPAADSSHRQAAQRSLSPPRGLSLSRSCQTLAAASAAAPSHHRRSRSSADVAAPVRFLVGDDEDSGGDETDVELRPGRSGSGEVVETADSDGEDPAAADCERCAGRLQDESHVADDVIDSGVTSPVSRRHSESIRDTCHYLRGYRSFRFSQPSGRPRKWRHLSDGSPPTPPVDGEPAPRRQRCRCGDALTPSGKLRKQVALLDTGRGGPGRQSLAPWACLGAGGADYVPDMPLWGCDNRHSWEHRLRQDLAAATTAGDECTCVVADCDAATVEVLSSHAFPVERAGGLGLAVVFAPLVSSLLERVCGLREAGAEAPLVVEMLEHQLTALAARAAETAQLLLNSSLTSLPQLTQMLGVDSSDVPLLLSAGSVLCPDITNKYGLSIR